MMLKQQNQLLSNNTRLICAVLTALLVICLCISVQAQSRNSVVVQPYIDSSTQNQPDATIIIDGKLVEAQSAQMYRGQQVMVWVRDLEKLGWGTVEPGKPGQVVFKGKTVTLTFTKGNGVALVNSLPVKLPINVYMHDTELMVPLSFVAKALGYQYEFGYKPVAMITSTTAKDSVETSNTITGKVLYDEKGVKGIVVRAVDTEFNPIDGAVTKTEADGSYTIDGLPDGSYMAYVYVNDNPSYFNRVSEAATVAKGATSHLKPIILGKIISPKTPHSSEKVSKDSERIEFTWAACEGASNYTLKITEGSKTTVASTSSPQPNTAISASKFKPGVVYTAEVKAFNEKGQFLGGTAGAGGKPWTFKIAD